MSEPDRSSNELSNWISEVMLGLFVVVVGSDSQLGFGELYLLISGEGIREMPSSRIVRFILSLSECSLLGRNSKLLESGLCGVCRLDTSERGASLEIGSSLKLWP